MAIERVSTLRLKDENVILKKKFAALGDEIKEQKETIKKKEHKQRILYEQVKKFNIVLFKIVFVYIEIHLKFKIYINIIKFFFFRFVI